MSNEKRVEHPAPWTWERDDAYRHPLTASRLVDANGATILESNTDDDVEAASPVVRELIRLAPELEAILREAEDPRFGCVICGGNAETRHEVYPHEDDCRLGVLLAALDAARKVTP